MVCCGALGRVSTSVVFRSRINKMIYLDVATQQRGRGSRAQRKRIRDFGAPARLTQVPVPDGGQADGIGYGRGNEAFEFFDEGEGRGVYGGPGACAWE
jgi:hypothetical protein